MSRTRKRRMMNQINVVPYIDVTLVLLVIFMVTAPMTNPGVVELPKVGQATQQVGSPIMITVKKNGEAEIAGKPLAREALLLAIKAELAKTQSAAPRTVVVAADQKTEYGKVVEVMDLIKQAKVEKVGLLFQPVH